jgi:hypothetical protein
LFRKVKLCYQKSFLDYVDVVASNDGLEASTSSWQPLQYLRELTIQREVPTGDYRGEDNERMVNTSTLIRLMSEHCIERHSHLGAIVIQPRAIKLTADKAFAEWIKAAMAPIIAARDKKALQDDIPYYTQKGDLEGAAWARNKLDRLIYQTGSMEPIFDPSCLSDLHISELVIDGSSETSGEQPGLALPNVDFVSLCEFIRRVKGLKTLVLRQVYVVRTNSFARLRPEPLPGVTKLVADRVRAGHGLANYSLTFRTGLLVGR